MKIHDASAATIAEGARILRAGGLVAFPTETVYGLGGDATNGHAVARIFAAKGRPAFNPLIVHIDAYDGVASLADSDPRCEALARKFWPGPLTMVLRRSSNCTASQLVSAGLPTIAVRMPDHAVAQALLRAVGRPLAAPSANASGTVSPTLAAHVAESLGEKVDLVIDGGPCRVGLESTVLDLTVAQAAVLRPGAITPAQIAAIIGPLATAEDSPAAPKSPGQLASHYAPSLPLRLNATGASSGEALLGFGQTPGATLNLSVRGDVIEAAANLFAMLRALDAPARYRAIAVAPVPMEGIGIAINDRLRRASAPKA